MKKLGFIAESRRWVVVFGSMAALSTMGKATLAQENQILLAQAPSGSGTVATETTATDDNLAAPDKGFYLSLGAGVQSRRQAVEQSGSSATAFDKGHALNLAAGYRVNRNFRAELEYSRQKNDVDRVAVTGAFNEPGSGDIVLTGWMLNGYYDFRSTNSRWAPYLGAGIGQYKSKINNLTSPTLRAGIPNPAGGFFVPPTIVNSTSPSVTALQFRAGTSYLINPNLNVFGGYRYFHGTERLSFNTATLGVLRPGGARTHGLELGVRYEF